MNQVPVFGTIGRAYAFTFGNLATITGLIWLPMALLVGLQYYFVSHYLAVLVSALADGNLYELNRANGLRFVFYIVSLLLQAILVTPVMRQALEMRQGRAFMSFQIGKTSLRVFAATGAFALVFIVIEYLAIFGLVLILLPLVAVAKAVGPVDGVSANLIAGVAALSLVVLFVAVLSYCAVRLSFLLVAVVASEGKIDLIRSWRLFDRNFVRVSVVLLAITLPLFLLHVALLWAALGFPLFHNPSPALLAEFRGAPTKILTYFVQFALSRMPFIFGVNLLLAPFWVGLSTGASAAAYRALVPAGKTDMRGAADGPVALEASPA